MDTILKLKARYFKEANFSSNTDCVIARAAKEQLHALEVNASAAFLYINNQVLYTTDYGRSQFLEDEAAAQRKNYSDEEVRSLKLTVAYRKLA